MLVAVTLVQAVAGPVLPVVRSTGEGRCPPVVADGDEVTVCARRDDDRFRLRPLPGDYEPEPARAAVDLPGGASAVAETEAAEIAPGVVSNRLMFRFKLPF